MNNIQFYLASSSPRRAQILQNLGFRFDVFCCDIDESPHPKEKSCDYVLRMALEKSNAARQRWYNMQSSQKAENLPFLSADTSVILSDEILGKPQNQAHAREMLQALSGREHQVVTAVCVADEQKVKTALQISQVRFKSLTEKEIDDYIATGEPMDKAGAYGIQQLGGAFIENITGSFTGVMGLPVFESVALLKEFGIELF
ncbi:septum formation inhibitor Maf [[Haemophilus] felis]|uniref:dTTP/UTP pyrophosphatase n=1 Tax=[Haemophilus] felis TaxID=123822 RepID=A0A1T0AX84_9PAST|nr:septum formation inhibitor Maf [[Haemophilus] felis]NBI40985.1 septum formation inhibitor Maf [[Haemophilus] felis]NBI42877.1 septum formation inhibitor Maf [[Haemophilus] felis]OOS02454.1 septum formation inhibitor Maf [[Haemophilus] felis]